MPLNYFKKGLRALGIAESFIKGEKGRASFAGVVMRSRSEEHTSELQSH